MMSNGNVGSIKLKKLNKPSTFPFNISSNSHYMIIFEHLFKKNPNYVPSYFFLVFFNVQFFRDQK